MSIHFIKSGELSALRVRLAEGGFKTYEVDCSDVGDKTSFFEAAMQDLPMGDASFDPDQQWRFPSGWDAFCDFLWQGLNENKDTSVAILLLNVQKLTGGRSLTIEEIVQCFAQVADAVRVEDKFAGIPGISLQIYLVNP